MVMVVATRQEELLTGAPVSRMCGVERGGVEKWGGREGERGGGLATTTTNLKKDVMREREREREGKKPGRGRHDDAHPASLSKLAMLTRSSDWLGREGKGGSRAG